MIEVTNELIYEVLKKLQDEGNRTSEDVRRVRNELSAMRGHMVALQADVHNIYDQMLEHGMRMDRIEQRLELTGSPA
jgi:predicted  nucleic acid-binding Zn-ribbon protein